MNPIKVWLNESVECYSNKNDTWYTEPHKPNCLEEILFGIIL